MTRGERGQEIGRAKEYACRDCLLAEPGDDSRGAVRELLAICTIYVQVLPPRLRDSLAKEAAETRLVQNDPKLRRELLKYRFLLHVRKDIEAICRAADAGDRGYGVEILLRAAVLSRVDLTEVYTPSIVCLET